MLKVKIDKLKTLPGLHVVSNLPEYIKRTSWGAPTFFQRVGGSTVKHFFSFSAVLKTKKYKGLDQNQRLNFSSFG